MMTNLNVALGLIGDAMNHLDHNDTVFGLLAEARELIEQELPAEPKADADEIERLRKERYRLRSALGAIIGLFHDSDHEAKNIARRVLDSTAENREAGQ